MHNDMTPIEKGNKIPIEDTLEIEKNEERKNIIENAREGRFKILGNVSKRVSSYTEKYLPEETKKKILSISSNVLDFTPISAVKMGTEAVKGKTFVGEELSLKDRIMYGLIVTSNLAFYGLTAYGISKGGDMDAIKLGAGFHVSSWVFLASQKGPELIQAAQNLATKYNMEPLNKFFIAFEKIVEKYGYKNLTKLINLKNATQ